MRVLYEDNHVIAVFKPSGTIVQDDASGRVSLMTLVKDYLRERYEKQGNVFLGLVHRLDRAVSGVVVFGRTSKGASRLSEQIRERTTKKEYLAIVSGALPVGKSEELRHFLLEEDGNPRIAIAGTRGAKEAVLRYEVIASRAHRTLLAVELVTGRKHQIRVQLSSLRRPIVGDRKYGSVETYLPGAIGLQCFAMEFSHPTREERLRVVVPEELRLAI